MSDSKLHLMSFAPVPDTKTTVHVVGLPDSLRDALFTLMPPRKEGGYLNTKVLKDDLRCWLDRAVELNPVRPNVHTDSWLIALAPIDLAKLCNVIAVWISSRKDIDTQSPAYRKVMGMLHPETFEEAVRGEEICLFSGDGRPAGGLTFPAFSAQVAAALPEATDPTACIVVLPGAESYKPKGKDDGGDPKRALRIAFAKTGRLTQFIEPEDSKDSPEIRARVAVRDLMRQLGFVPEPARNSRGIDTSIPAIGLKVYNSGNGKAQASFPYCVRQDMRSGAVTVYCPLLPDGSLPYWRALIEFARLSGSEGFPDSCKRANGMALKRMLHGIVRATGDRPELLLINSYGRIRQRDWWPGISDSGLESGPLSYGPTGYEEPLGLAGSKLRILRIRSGLNGEIPDWFTDEVAAGGADDGTVPNRRDKQGLFKMDGYFLALAPRPGDAQYKWSARGSKYDSPTAAFCEKTINEYCLLSPGGEAEALASVKYAEALRGCMVQLYKNDMRVNLPAPLHLAEQVEEYIWDWELTGRR